MVEQEYTEAEMLAIDYVREVEESDREITSTEKVLADDIITLREMLISVQEAVKLFDQDRYNVED